MGIFSCNCVVHVKQKHTIIIPEGILLYIYIDVQFQIYIRGRRGRMVVGFITTCAIGAYHHKCCEFESHSWRGVLNTTLRNKVT